MNKWNKKLILMLVLLLVVGILGGCSDELPDGIESKTFFKDLNKGYSTIIRSMADNNYNEKAIDEIFAKMNKDSYKEKLNDYELLILESLNNSLDGIEKDLTTGEKIIKSETISDISWIFDMISEYNKP